MKADVSPGKYILAVSGGVDSIVLLDLLAKRTDLSMVVVHFDHGMRSESGSDAEFVREAANKYNLPFELGRARLAGASEADARAARYKFMFEQVSNHEADGILTAHHQDDLIETALLNILRGTGPAGLTAIADNALVKRPLLGIPKSDILIYAQTNNLSWREDSSNKSDRYLRNYLRKHITPQMSPTERQTILKNIEQIMRANQQMETLLKTITHRIIKGNQVDRHEYTQLPTDVGRKLLYEFLKSGATYELDKKMIERLDIAIRTGRAGSQHDIKQGEKLQLSTSTAIVIPVQLR